MSTVVFVPVKDCDRWLPRFLHMLERLKDVSRVVFSYGRSRDNTFPILMQYKSHSKHNVEVYEEPRKLKALSSAQISPIYRDFQGMMKEDETHCLLLDADIMVATPNLISRLKRYGKDIIAPYVWVLNQNPRQFYDSYVFRVKGCRYFPFDPPHAHDKKPVQVDSVGTCMLVKKEVFMATPYDDPYPHMRFCDESREKGYEVWADPSTSIYHVDLMRFNIAHFPLEMLTGQPVESAPYMDSEGNLYQPASIEGYIVNAVVWGDWRGPETLK